MVDKSKLKPSYDSWLAGTDYKCSKLLGEGAYGQVVEAIHKPS